MDTRNPVPSSVYRPQAVQLHVAVDRPPRILTRGLSGTLWDAESADSGGSAWRWEFKCLGSVRTPCSGPEANLLWVG